MLLWSRLEAAFLDAVRLKSRFVVEQGRQVTAAARLIADVLQSGGKALIFGNGGSAADAQHFAAELVNRFQVERPPLAALALTTDTSVLTSIANDYDFTEVFAKQVQALGKPGDVAIGISTSGASLNVVRALEAARNAGLKTLALTGGAGGPVTAVADLAIIVPSQVTPRIQEVHLTVIHILCDLVDFLLFPDKFADRQN